MVTLDTIRAARDRIEGAIYRSPCPHSYNLSRLCNADIYCKFDHLQVTGSFKERGARNKLALLKEKLEARSEKRERPSSVVSGPLSVGPRAASSATDNGPLTTDNSRNSQPATRNSGPSFGIIAASAGNHAQALAYHGRELGIPVTVVMPKWAPLVKVSNCRSFNATVILHGETYEQAKQHALTLARDNGLTYIPGFDDPDIISGQGTLGLEILEELPDVEAIIVPVGGGGLIAGIATAVKALKPTVRIVGVEPINAPTLHASLAAGKVTRIETRPTLADGLAIAEVGQLCFELIRPRLDELLLVDEPTIARSVLKLLEYEKTMVEGAGAVPLAAAMTPSCNLQGKKVVLVLAGGNIDVTTLARIIERGLAADGRLCRFTTCAADRPGSLARLAAALANAGASILDISHDRHFGPADPALVTITATCETRDAAHIAEVEKALKAAGVEAVRSE